MTKNLTLAAVAAAFWTLSTTTSSVEGLGPTSDFLAFSAQAMCVMWVLHGLFLIFRQSEDHDLS
ncbi:hypothetical protein ASAP_2279 [Asaia bogorensis]|uniref:Uncharacterized protein n=1 Tax=Asaia bogorensis TaxID=91915 RepID=A0A060QGR4_9PROT|nr:hypothetical protein ASAP_2279 [Asaia bogorensis]